MNIQNDPYKMTVDLNVLEHLGINLYSNLAAVLTEIVANAWDADATKIDIEVDDSSPCEFIKISDNGIGMTVEDMNTKYLKVGYRRRSDQTTTTGKTTAKGRKVMGRKGLGKLALFSIAEHVTIQSIGADDKPHGLSMDANSIREAITSGQAQYSPIPLESTEINISQGTLIELSGINKHKLSRSIDSLRKRLARRFSIFSDEFSITINGKTLTLQDRDDLQNTQYIWLIKDTVLDPSPFPNIIEQFTINNQLDAWSLSDDTQNWKISGWIGTAKKPKQLDSSEVGNLNSIVVLSRGRLFHENILDKLNDGRIYTKYLTGQIEADFLDDDEQQDIATSDRQRIQEDDSRYQALLAFMKSTLTTVERQWSEHRKASEAASTYELLPALKEWVDSLPNSYKKNAESLIENLSVLPIESEEDKKTLFKHGILAFERIRLREDDASLLAEGVAHNPQALIQILAQRDSIESSLYGDIVKSRLDTIKSLRELTDENAKEKVLQKYLFDHLWLLDPSWERAENTEIMESRLIDSGISTTDMNEKERLGRVDIAYRTTANKHVIIELKRAARMMDLFDLITQGSSYVDKLKKILMQTENDAEPNIEVVFILGRLITESNTQRIKSMMDGISPGSRIVYYDGLIQNAQKAYQEYLSKTKELDEVSKILDNL